MLHFPGGLRILSFFIFQPLKHPWKSSTSWGGGFLDFSDRAEDLDSLEIGGEVTFQEPYDLSNAAQRNIGVSRLGEGGDDRTLEVGFHHLGVRLDGWILGWNKDAILWNNMKW